MTRLHLLRFETENGRPMAEVVLNWLVLLSHSTKDLSETVRLKQNRLEYQGFWEIKAQSQIDFAHSAWAAAGRPEIVRELFHHASHCYLPLFELRGTQFNEFGKDVVDEQGNRRREIHLRTPQWTPTNSTRNVEGVVTALCAGDDVLAGRISALVTDQPEDDRWPPNPKLKRPNEFFLAMALKALFAGDRNAFASHLGQLKFTPHKFTEFGIQARMLRAIADTDSDGFVRGLVDLLEWFEGWAGHSKRCREIESLGCWPSAAWSVLACRKGVVAIDDLPDCSSYYPLDLVRAAVAFDPAARPFEFRPFTLEEFQFDLSVASDEWLATTGMTLDGTAKPASGSVSRAPDGSEHP